MRAIENPLVDVIGHLTGRKIERRPPYELDFPAVFDAAARIAHDARDQLQSRSAATSTTRTPAPPRRPGSGS